MTNKMTVEDARRLRGDLEKDIQKLLDEFMDRTGLIVSKIEMPLVSVQAINDVETRIMFGNVSVKVELPDG